MPSRTDAYCSSSSIHSRFPFGRYLPAAVLSVIFLLVTLLSLLLPAPCRSEADVPDEYQVKAAYLAKFIKYVDWQEITDVGDGDQLIIGIMGSQPMWEAAAHLAGKKVLNHTLQLRRVTTVEELSGCRLVFIGASEQGQLQRILDVAARNHILTVSDIRRFVRAGGGIGFVNRGETIRFEINTRAAKGAGANISSQLLHLAEKVVE